MGSNCETTILFTFTGLLTDLFPFPRTPRPSISLENLHRLRVSSSKITLDGRDDQTEIPEPDDEKGSTITLEDKNRPLRRSFSFTQRNFRRNAVIEAPGEGLSGKRSGDSHVSRGIPHILGCPHTCRGHGVVSPLVSLCRLISSAPFSPVVTQVNFSNFAELRNSWSFQSFSSRANCIPSRYERC